MLLFVALFALALVYYVWTSLHPRNFPPGPRMPLPLVGDHRNLLESPNMTARRLRKAYGDVVGYWDILGQRTVIVFDAEMFQEVATKSAFGGRAVPTSYHTMTRNMSDGSIPGIIFSDGAVWREQHSFTLHTLRNLGFGKKSMEDGILEEAVDLCGHLESLEGSPVDMGTEFNLSTLSVLWRLVAGERLPRDSDKLKSLVLAIDGMSSTPYYPLTDILFSSPMVTWLMERLSRLSSFVDLFNAVENLCEESIAKRKQDLQQESGELLCLVDHYLAKIDSETLKGKPSSFSGSDGHLNLLEVSKELFLVGGETTSNALNWSLLCLVLNPRVQPRVHQELDNVTGRRRLPCLDDRQRTPYTEAVLHEVLRLALIAPTTGGQRAIADGIIADKEHGREYFIPKGTDIVCNLEAAMTDPRYFPNPDKFDPERYLTADGQIFTPHPKMLAFGLGKRRCLGESLAKQEFYLFFATILSRFEIRNAPENGHLSMEPKMGFTNSPKPFKVKFIPRT